MIFVVEGICILFSVYLCKKINKIQKLCMTWCIKYSLVKSMFALGLYIYYVGYEVADLTALLTPSNLILLFMFISIFSGIVCACWKKMVLPIRKIDYQIDKIDKIVFVIVVMVSFALRSIGYRWGGENITFQPDEGKVVSPAILMAENNTFMSEEINYPSHISHKILSIVFKVVNLCWGGMAESFSEINYIYVTRIYIAIISVGIVVCVFFIGNHLRKHVGTASAVMVCVFPPFVQAAHNATGDPIVVLFMVLTMLCSLYYFENIASYFLLFLMSFFAACATLEKYHGAVICALIAITIIISEYQNGRIRIDNIIRKGIISSIFYVFCLTLISPNLMIKIPEVVTQLKHLANDYEAGLSFGENASNYFWWYISHAGVLCVGMIIYGLIVLKKYWNKKYLILTVGLVEIFVICLQNRSFIRWGYPFYVCLFLVAGLGVVELIQKMSGIYRCISYVILLVMIVNNTVGSLFIDLVFIKSWTQDARNVSKQWCVEQGIAPINCIYDYYTCWNPGGYVDEHVEWNGVITSLQEIDGKLYVSTFGRDYAITIEEQEEVVLKYPEQIKLVKEYDTVYKDSGGSLMLYNNYSKKIYELVNIMDMIEMGERLWKNKMYTGYNTYIYDIGSVPAFEEFAFEEMDVEPEEQDFIGDIIVSKWIKSMKKGKYEVSFIGKKADRYEVVLVDNDGNIILDTDISEGKTSFEIFRDYYNVKLKIYVSTQKDRFERMIITEK